MESNSFPDNSTPQSAPTSSILPLDFNIQPLSQHDTDSTPSIQTPQPTPTHNSEESEASGSDTDSSQEDFSNPTSENGSLSETDDSETGIEVPQNVPAAISLTPLQFPKNSHIYKVFNQNQGENLNSSLPSPFLNRRVKSVPLPETKLLDSSLLFPSDPLPTPHLTKGYEHPDPSPSGSTSSPEKSIPKQTRHVPVVQLPKGSTSSYFHKVPDYKLLAKHFFHQGKIHFDDAMYLSEAATNVLSQEPNLLQIPYPCNVIGDIHGQYYDLLSIFKISGWPSPENPYLFLGDLVDRGTFSVEVLLLIFALKLNFPESLFIIRGNHETAEMTQVFNFRLECLHKYNLKLYHIFLQSFKSIPLAAILGKRFFCVHGGISPNLSTMSQFDRISRFKEPPEEGLMNDLLWADPLVPNLNEHHARYETVGLEDTSFYDTEERQGFFRNSSRNTSYFFTWKAAATFLHVNHLFCILRAHEVMHNGFYLYKKFNSYPTCISLFSAPKYCGIENNLGAYARVDHDKVEINVFEAVEHPFVYANFENAIQKSLPVIVEAVAEILWVALRAPVIKRKAKPIFSGDESLSDSASNISHSTVDHVSSVKNGDGDGEDPSIFKKTQNKAQNVHEHNDAILSGDTIPKSTSTTGTFDTSQTPTPDSPHKLSRKHLKRKNKKHGHRKQKLHNNQSQNTLPTLESATSATSGISGISTEEESKSTTPHMMHSDSLLKTLVKTSARLPSTFDINLQDAQIVASTPEIETITASSETSTSSTTMVPLSTDIQIPSETFPQTQPETETEIETETNPSISSFDPVSPPDSPRGKKSSYFDTPYDNDMSVRYDSLEAFQAAIEAAATKSQSGHTIVRKNSGITEIPEHNNDTSSDGFVHVRGSDVLRTLRQSLEMLNQEYEFIQEGEENIVDLPINIKIHTESPFMDSSQDRESLKEEIDGLANAISNVRSMLFKDEPLSARGYRPVSNEPLTKKAKRLLRQGKFFLIHKKQLANDEIIPFRHPIYPNAPLPTEPKPLISIQKFHKIPNTDLFT